MSQYVSRIHVRVKEDKDFEVLEKLDFSKTGVDFDADFLSSCDNDDLDYTIFGDASYMEDELFTIVKTISEALPGRVIVIADTTNINVDPYTYCVYSIGGKTQSVYFMRGKRAEMFEYADISDIMEWLSFGRFHLTDEENEFVKDCLTP